MIAQPFNSFQDHELVFLLQCVLPGITLSGFNSGDDLAAVFHVHGL